MFSFSKIISSLTGGGDAEENASQQQDSDAPKATTIQLFKWMAAPRGNGGTWADVSNDAKPHIYNINDDEDDDERAPEWRLELEGAQDSPDVYIDDTFEFQRSELRCIFLGDDNSVWALSFPNPESFFMFNERYNKALFENMYGVEKTEEAELKIFGADFMMRFGGENETSRKEWADDMDIDQPTAAELRARDTTPKRERLAATRQDNIRGVVMGAGERSYLVRDSGIDVMRNVVGGIEDMDMSLNITITPNKGIGGGRRPGKLDLPGTPLSVGGTDGAGTPTPSKIVLMNEESRMNMLTPGSTQLYHKSIETGQVVREFSFTKDNVPIPMRDMTTDTKRSQLENRNTFLTLDTNRLARWDLRDPTGMVQEMTSPAALSYVAGKDYARGTKFSCMATSGDGYVVVGSDDGKVRLYSEKTLTQAKTSIPGLGQPITNVAVTYDGKWVLATTKSYLMVVKTAYKDPTSGKELCGFTSKMGGSAPAPRLLRLKPADIARTGGAPLEKAHFTWITEQGKQERWIVASCGNYTVLWNFRSVKIAEPNVTSLGGLTTVSDYHLIPKQEHVVDSVFMHEKYGGTRRGDDSMVIVTQRQVYNAVEDDSTEEDED